MALIERDLVTQRHATLDRLGDALRGHADRLRIDAVAELDGLCLRLSGERFWTEWSGYHQGMLTKLARVGAGTYERLT